MAFTTMALLGLAAGAGIFGARKKAAAPVVKGRNDSPTYAAAAAPAAPAVPQPVAAQPVEATPAPVDALKASSDARLLAQQSAMKARRRAGKAALLPQPGGPNTAGSARLAPRTLIGGY